MTGHSEEAQWEELQEASRCHGLHGVCRWIQLTDSQSLGPQLILVRKWILPTSYMSLEADFFSPTKLPAENTTQWMNIIEHRVRVRAEELAKLGLDSWSTEMPIVLASLWLFVTHQWKMNIHLPLDYKLCVSRNHIHIVFLTVSPAPHTVLNKYLLN